MSGMGLLVKEHVAPDGKPDPHASETEPGNPPVFKGTGLTLAVKVATPPAITVAAEGGTMLTEKSLTWADCGVDET